jgi:hypothetical protein
MKQEISKILDRTRESKVRLTPSGRPEGSSYAEKATSSFENLSKAGPAPRDLVEARRGVAFPGKDLEKRLRSCCSGSALSFPLAGGRP